MIVLRGSTLLLQRCSTHRQTITSLRPRVAPGSTMCDQLHQTESQKSPPNHMIKRAAPFDKQVWLSSLLSLFPIPSIPGRFQRNATSLNLKITEEKTREWPDFFCISNLPVWAPTRNHCCCRWLNPWVATKICRCVAKRYSKLNTDPFSLTFWCPEIKIEARSFSLQILAVHCSPISYNLQDRLLHSPCRTGGCLVALTAQHGLHLSGIPSGLTSQESGDETGCQISRQYIRMVKGLVTYK